MKFRLTIVLLLCISCFSCCKRPNTLHRSKTLQQAQMLYDSGLALMQQDTALAAFSIMSQVVDSLEILPEDMTDDEMRLVSKAYYQMGRILDQKMVPLDVELYERACYYQEMLHDTALLSQTWFSLALNNMSPSGAKEARPYIKKVMAITDSVADINRFYEVKGILPDYYFYEKEYDSCYALQQQIIAEKEQLGLDPTRDRFRYGMQMYFGGRHVESKNYLLKILDFETDTTAIGAIMGLLLQIYEYEGNADSVAYCQSFMKSYVHAETIRNSDGMNLQVLYQQFKEDRDARLTAMREQKQQRKTRCWICLLLVVALALTMALMLPIVRRFQKKESEAKLYRELSQHKERETQRLRSEIENSAQRSLDLLLQRVKAIYQTSGEDKLRRIMAEFEATYPQTMAKLGKAYPDLSETERNLAILTFLRFRAKEEAELLGLSENTVRKYRSVLNKKLDSDQFSAFVG